MTRFNFFSYDAFSNGYYFNAFELSTSNKSNLSNLIPSICVGKYSFLVFNIKDINFGCVETSLHEFHRDNSCEAGEHRDRLYAGEPPLPFTFVEILPWTNL